MSYYEVPPHTHIADVSLHRSDRGYAVTAALVTVPDRADAEPYTDTRTWYVDSSNLWRDLASAGWGMDHYDRFFGGERIHAVPSVGSTLPLPEMLTESANRARHCASDSERQAYNDIAELRAQLREYTHPHAPHPDPALPVADIDAAERAARLAGRDHPTDPRRAGTPSPGNSAPQSTSYRSAAHNRTDPGRDTDAGR